jgi:hypothetical protein
MRIVKSIAISFLWGVALTGLIMLVPYEHCMDGDARGLPFGVTAPSCGPSWGPAIMLEPDTKNGQMFDFGTLLADVVVWTAVSAFARCWLLKLRPQKLPETHENAA